MAKSKKMIEDGEKIFTAKPVAVFYPGRYGEDGDKAHDISFDIVHSTPTKEQENIINLFSHLICFDYRIKIISNYFIKNGFIVDIIK